jgi:hypothetical protein
MSSSALAYDEEERANRSANQGLLRFVEAYRLNAHLQGLTSSYSYHNARLALKRLID